MADAIASMIYTDYGLPFIVAFQFPSVGVRHIVSA